MSKEKKVHGAKRWWDSLTPEQREEQIERRRKGQVAAHERRRQEEVLQEGLPFEHCTVDQLRDHILRCSGKAGEELARRGATLVVAWRGWAIGLPGHKRPEDTQTALLQ